MLEKSNLKTISKALALLGLTLALVLSPCKVRNFIQDELGVPQTEISNKNKTTFSESCSDFELSLKHLDHENNSVANVFGVLNYLDFSFDTSTVKRSSLLPENYDILTVSSIPFYILYQNFKDYL